MLWWVQRAHFQSFDLLNGLPGYSLEVTIHPSCCPHDSINLFLSFCPLFDNGLLFPVQILLHGGEGLNDRLDPMPKTWSGQILVNHLRLGLLALRRLPSRGNFNKCMT